MKTILLIDDEDDVREYFIRFMKLKGYTVFGFSTAEEGLIFFKEHKPDCIFLDQHLPGMSGLTALEKIRQISPQAKVYIITGDESPALKETANSLGVEGYLVKPIDSDQLTEILENV